MGSNFKCRILAHSVNPVGDEAITYELCYERFIHAEFLTHRGFARNASSSRAIPYRKMVDWTLADPAMPLHLGRNQKGMQSGGEVDDPGLCRKHIRWGLHEAIDRADRLHDGEGLHKEIVNRYLEPWGWINVVVTTGRPALMHFFHLRCSPYAHPNIQRLAVTMARQYRESTPKKLEAGEWHLPYTDDLGEINAINEGLMVIWSVARSAWVSYRTVDGKVADLESARRRHDDCVALKHMTPCEHQLRARGDHGRAAGPIAGFDQYRHMIPGESADQFDFGILDSVYADRDFAIAGP